MQIFLSIDPFLDKPKLSAMPDWDARRRFGVFFVGVSGLLWPVLRVHAGRQREGAGKSGTKGEGQVRKVQALGVPGQEEGPQHTRIAKDLKTAYSTIRDWLLRMRDRGLKGRFNARPKGRRAWLSL